MNDSQALTLIRDQIRYEIKEWHSVTGHGIVVEFLSPDEKLDPYIEFDYPHDHIYFEILDMTDYVEGDFIPSKSPRRKHVVCEKIQGNEAVVFRQINDALKEMMSQGAE